jgi:hypothetical protein
MSAYTGSYFYFYNSYSSNWTINYTLLFKNCSISGSLFYLFSYASSNLFTNIIAEGCDFSSLNSNAIIVNGASSISPGSKIHFRNCKLAETYSLISNSGTINQPDILFDNCLFNNIYQNSQYLYQGQLSISYTINRINGAYSTTNFSWKLMTNSNCSFLKPFEVSPITMWCNTTYVTYNAIVEFLHDGIGPLGSNDIWAELEYQGSTESPISSFISTRSPKYPMSIGSYTHPQESNVTWNSVNITNPYYQKFQLQFISMMQGLVNIRIYLARPNYNIYIDPMIIITTS